MKYLFLVLLIGSAMVWSGDKDVSLKRAGALMREGQIQAGLDMYAAVRKLEPKNGVAWMHSAYAWLSVKQYEKAIDAFEKADELGFAPFLARYNLISTHAILGQKQAAMDWFEKAIDVGYANIEQLESDSNLDSLRKEPRFVALLKQAKRQAWPCLYDDRYRALDFWVGDWDVYDQYGHRIGSDRIEASHQGCMVQENWSGLHNGGEGYSASFYDPNTQTWRQNWVGDNGQVSMMIGEVRSDGIHFLSESVNAKGEPVTNSMILSSSENGPVQTFRTSSDGGKTWTTTGRNSFRAKKQAAQGAKP